jgi:hypothetical protein
MFFRTLGKFIADCEVRIQYSLNICSENLKFYSLEVPTTTNDIFLKIKNTLLDQIQEPYRTDRKPSWVAGDDDDDVICVLMIFFL